MKKSPIKSVALKMSIAGIRLTFVFSASVLLPERFGKARPTLHLRHPLKGFSRAPR